MKKIILLVGVLIELSILLISYYNYFKPHKIIENNLTLSNIKDYKDDYIIGVVACEMPASYNIEALKAQAVAARTFLEYSLLNNKNISFVNIGQCYSDLKTLKNKWNNEYENYYSKIREAVISTKDEVMLMDNKLFKSFYFSTSNGYTESSLDVFNEGNIKSVSSLWDKDLKDYEVVTKYTKDKLTQLLGNFNNIEIIKRNNTNHVLEVQIDNKVLTGIEIRKLLSLRSTDFDISKENDTYIFTTRGYGHGVGMSQTGAEYLANKGYDYKYILNYYYQDIEINKI